ncbi:MAG: PAS domain S-box protein [Proteobacteria bacterium]|nr:PAS domain S-box protein [Pseudomonadota bacterium]
MPEHHDAAPQDRRLTDAELQSERAQFALAERAARFGYWRLRLADNHVTWSPGMYKLLGVDPSQKADNTWLLDQIVPEDVTVLVERINNAIRTRTGFYYQTRSKDPAAAAQIVDTHGEVEVGPDGRVVSVIGVCHDVTQQAKAEAERKRAEEMYRVMTEQSSDIIILFAPGGDIVFASNALEQSLKRSIADIEHNKFFELIHPDDLEEASKLNLERAPDKTVTATFRIRHGDGHYVWQEVSMRGHYDDRGVYKNAVSVSRDVTERKTQELRMKMAQQRAETANKAKSLFLANMSHELRTPLNAVIGFADIMREEMFGALGHPRYGEYAALICDSGQHLLDLISDILDMAKIDAGKLDLNFETVEIGPLVEECVRLLRERAQTANIRLAAELPPAGLSLTADRRALKQILLNLLSNAVRFTASGGKVRAAAHLEGSEIHFVVKDNGIGIPEKDIARLGRPFEQVCIDPMLAKGGTGLGLAMVRALAEKHGGAMQIESTVGEGTTVTIRLPRVQDKQAAA